LISNNNTKLFKPLNNLITLRTNNKKKLDTKRIKRRIANISNIKSNFINNNGKEMMSIKKFKGNKINNQFRGFSLRRRFIKALKKNKYKSKSFAKRKFRNRFKKFKFRRNLRKLKKARLR
jgi:ribosomal protein S3AE